MNTNLINNINTVLHKHDNSAVITASIKRKVVGSAELTKANKQWNLNRLYINEAYDQVLITNKLMQKINELKQEDEEEKVDPALNSLLTYLEKD